MRSHLLKAGFDLSHFDDVAKEMATDNFLNSPAGETALDVWKESSDREDATPPDSDSSSSSSDAGSSDDDSPATPMQFYKPAAKASGGHDAKWHVPHWLEPDQVACNTRGMKLADMRPMGPSPPDDLSRICARCLRARPDLYALFPSLAMRG